MVPNINANTGLYDMDIIIKESNKREVLKLIDPQTGINMISDIVGNVGGFNDGQFTATDDDAYICNQERFDWWDDVIDGMQKMYDRVHEMKEEYGAAAINDALDQEFTDELPLYVDAVNKALDAVECD